MSRVEEILTEAPSATNRSMVHNLRRPSRPSPLLWVRSPGLRTSCPGPRDRRKRATGQHRLRAPDLRSAGCMKAYRQVVTMLVRADFSPLVMVIAYFVLTAVYR